VKRIASGAKASPAAPSASRAVDQVVVRGDGRPYPRESTTTSALTVGEPQGNRRTTLRLEGRSILRITGMAGARSAAQREEAVGIAISGDDAFRRAVGLHRAALHRHCYRMLGSAYDADDALQDALLRAWRGLEGFDSGRPLRPWLYKIATNVCLDMLAKRERRCLPFDRTAPGAGGALPLPDSEWLTPYPDEALALAAQEALTRASNSGRRSSSPSSPRCSCFQLASARASC
jgi:RNA polymerase sigma factor (sigma-70 family)